VNEILRFVKSVWLTIRSNRVFVAFEGAFFGAIGDALEDELHSGHIDLSHEGVKKLLLHSFVSAFVATRLLVRPTPITASEP
jgi:uncharacterized membrane protein